MTTWFSSVKTIYVPKNKNISCRQTVAFDIERSLEEFRIYWPLLMFIFTKHKFILTVIFPLPTLAVKEPSLAQCCVSTQSLSPSWWDTNDRISVFQWSPLSEGHLQFMALNIVLHFWHMGPKRLLLDWFSLTQAFFVTGPYSELELYILNIPTWNHPTLSDLTNQVFRLTFDRWVTWSTMTVFKAA